MTSHPKNFPEQRIRESNILPADSEAIKNPELDTYCRAIIGTVHALTGRYPELSEKVDDEYYVWGGMSSDLQMLTCVYAKDTSDHTSNLKLPALWIRTNGIINTLSNSCHLLYSQDGGNSIESQRFSSRQGWKDMSANNAKKLFFQQLNPLHKSDKMYALSHRNIEESLRLWQASIDMHDDK